MYASLDSAMSKVEQVAQRVKERDSIRQAQHQAWRGGER